MYRHGHRTILKSYPTDPYQDQSFWPVPYGELTNVSMSENKHSFSSSSAKSGAPNVGYNLGIFFLILRASFNFHYLMTMMTKLYRNDNDGAFTKISVIVFFLGRLGSKKEGIRVLSFVSE